MLISNIRENGEPIGALPDGEMMFHHDMIHSEVPSKGDAALFGRDPDPWRQHAVRERLCRLRDARPANCATALEGKRAIHHYNYGNQQRGSGGGTEAFGECVHPVFRTHEETKRKAVYVNRLMTDAVVDMEREESDELLNAVFDHAEKPEFVYEHVWRLGDLLLWDNRCSSHARTDFPADQRRLMLRTTVNGTTRPY